MGHARRPGDSGGHGTGACSITGSWKERVVKKKNIALITLGNEDPVGCLEYKQKSYRSLVLNASPNTRSRKKCKILKNMQDLAENARSCKKMQGLA